MCVIMVVETDRPSEHMVNRAWGMNDDGGGVAWREEIDGLTLVRWKKGLTLSEMQEMCRELPIPYIAHFRIASVGGVCDELCHPFPVDIGGLNVTDGQTGGGVLFHNGDWKEWREVGTQVASSAGIKLPGGKWSDSRAMAWLIPTLGPGFMDFYGHKGVLFTPDDIEIFWGESGWKDINGVLCSNDYFTYRQRKGNTAFSTPVMCKNKHCCRTDLVKDGYCTYHANEMAANKNGADQPKSEVNPTQKSGGETVTDTTSGANGGPRVPTPFQVLMNAERLHKEGKLSKKKLKRLRRKLTGSASQPQG